MHLTVESVWSAFCQVLYEAIELYVPYATTNMAGTKKQYSRKYPKTIRKAFSRKRCLWRKHRQNLQNPHILNKYKEAEAKCRQLVHEYEAVTERRISNNSNVGSFYRHINKRMSCRSGVGVLHSTDGTDAVSDLEKAEIVYSTTTLQVSAQLTMASSLSLTD